MNTLELTYFVNNKYGKLFRDIIYTLLEKETEYKQVRFNVLDSNITINLNTGKKDYSKDKLIHTFKCKYGIGDIVVFNNKTWKIKAIDFKLINEKDIKILYTLLNIEDETIEVAYENNILL